MRSSSQKFLRARFAHLGHGLAGHTPRGDGAEVEVGAHLGAAVGVGGVGAAGAVRREVRSAPAVPAGAGLVRAAGGVVHGADAVVDGKARDGVGDVFAAEHVRHEGYEALPGRDAGREVFVRGGVAPDAARGGGGLAEGEGAEVRAARGAHGQHARGVDGKHWAVGGLREALLPAGQVARGEVLDEDGRGVAAEGDEGARCAGCAGLRFEVQDVADAAAGEGVAEVEGALQEEGVRAVGGVPGPVREALVDEQRQARAVGREARGVEGGVVVGP